MIYTKKNIVVVVGNERIPFEGEDLDAINKGDGTRPMGKSAAESLGGVVEGVNTILIIRENVKDKPKVIAVFNKWDYWKYV